MLQDPFKPVKPFVPGVERENGLFQVKSLAVEFCSLYLHVHEI
jgi:hypothetical protein